MKLVGGDSGPLRARELRRGGPARAVRAGRRRRALRAAGRARARAPNAGARLPARVDHRGATSRPSRRSQSSSRAAHATATWQPSASDRALPRCPARQDARLRRRDGLRGVPKAPVSTPVRCTRTSSARSRALPEVRDEAPAGRGARDELRLPDAPRRHQRLTRPLSRVRHEAPAGASRRHAPSTLGTKHDAPRGASRPRASTRRSREHGTPTTPRARAGHRVGRRHGRGEPAHDAREHALEARRSRHRRRERRHRLEVPGWGSGQDPPRQRDGLRPSDAAPVPRPRRRALSRSCTRRRRGAEPRLEGHRARPTRARRSTSCSTSPTRAAGWRTATSPSITRAE